MTKKHFNALAQAIAAITDAEQRRNLCDVIGNVCAESNPSFSWSRWREACGCEIA